MLSQFDIFPFVNWRHYFRFLWVEQFREGTFAFERDKLGRIDDLLHCQVPHRLVSNCIDIDIFEEGSYLLKRILDLGAIHACLFAIADSLG
jgi:hypothetical protein